MTEEREPIFEMENVSESSEKAEDKDLYATWKSVFDAFNIVSSMTEMPVGELVYTDKIEDEENLYINLGVIRQSLSNQPEEIKVLIFRSKDGGKEEEMVIQTVFAETEWYGGKFSSIAIDAEGGVPAEVIPYEPILVADMANAVLDKEIAKHVKNLGEN